jgi:hypothetical protein
MNFRVICLLFTSFSLVLPTAAQVSGGGSTNYIPIWTNSTTLGNSTIFQSFGNVGIGTTTPSATLAVIGRNGVAGFPVLQVIGGKAGFSMFNGALGSAIQLTAGTGGGGLSGKGGVGGPIQITAGNGGRGLPGGDGGSVQITGGHPTFLGGGGGSITLTPGLNLGGKPGNVILNVPFGSNVGVGTSSPTATLDVVSGGTMLADAWTTRSSRRFKTNIEPLEGALEKVTQLQGVSYASKTDGKHEIGLVAEDVYRVIPEVVSRDRKTNEVQGVDYSRLAALLIEAVKSQQIELQSQWAEIQGLKSQIEQLKSNSVGQ